MAYLGKSPSQGVRNRYYFTASGGETSISGALTGGTLTFTDGNYVDVNLNGVTLVAGTDYNTSTANTIAGLSALTASDVVEIVVYDVFSVFSGNVNSDFSVGGNLSVTGTTAFTGATTITGLTTTGDINFGDNDKASFSSGKLQMYHDGTNAYIDETFANGTFLIRGNNISLQKYTGETMIQCVSDGKVELNFNNVPKLETTSSGIDVTGVITTDGMTTSADINFGDNDKAIFGAGNDLQIYHDGSASRIVDAGTGGLTLQADANVVIQNSAGTETKAEFTTDGAVNLYYDTALKLATTSSGIDITGGFTATDGCTITTADNDPQLTLVSTDADATQGPVLKFYRNSASPADNDLIGQLLFHGEDGAGNDQQYANIQSIITNNAHGNESSSLNISTIKGGSVEQSVKFGATETVFNESSLDLDFRVESDSNTHMLFVDAGNNKVRLNTTANQVMGYELFTCNGAAGFKNGDASVVGVWQTQTSAFAMQFFSGAAGNNVGSISVTASATAFNTSSDYRLKENVTYDWDATTRLKQLKPARFNFIADADTTVDGFLAHEAQAVVPEAVTGTHNEVDDDGNPVMQGIDQSKIVPLLVKTIQELEARIAALET